MDKKHLILLTLTIVLFFISSSDILAQCPMCKIAAESNLENGGSAGKGLNTGILYMLMMPYFIIGILGFIWYRNRKITPELSDDTILTK